METVEVVIKIPKEDFDFIKDEFADGDMPDEKDLKETTYYAIANGTVLPKGHGRLIDADAFIKFMQTVSKTRKYDELWIDNFLTVDDTFNAVIASIKNEGTSNGDAPTVIEADKDGQDER